MLIVLSGIDGSGKTTISQALVNDFESENKSAFKLSAFGYIIFRPIISLFRLFKKGNRESSCHKNPLLSCENKNPLFKIWPFLALIDNWIYFYVKIKFKLFKYSFCVTDKYFYDMAASFTYYGYSSERINWIYTKLIPKPDLGLILDLPPELAFKRKKELNLDYYKIQRGYYLKLAKKFNFAIIDASQPKDLVLGEIKRIIDLKRKQAKYA